MAGKNSGKMREFVQGRNTDGNGPRQEDAPKKGTGFDDMKVPVPKTRAASNTRQTRINNQQITQQPQQADSRTQPHHVDTNKHKLNGESQFYDTDASSLGASSNTESARQSNAKPSRAPPKQSSSEGGSVDEDDDGEEEDGSDDEELPDQPWAPQISSIHLNEDQHRIMAEHERLKGKDGASLPYVKGDSYPDTTSGRLSAVASNGSDKQAAAQTNAATVVPQTGHLHRSSMRAPITASNMNQHARQPVKSNQRSQPEGHNPTLSQPKHDNPAVQYYATVDGRSMSPRESKIVIHPPPRQHEQSLTSTSQKATKGKTAPDTSVSTHNPNERPVFRTVVAKTVAQVQPRHQSSSPPKRAHGRTAEQKHIIKAAPDDYEGIPDDDVVQQGFTSSDHPTTEHEPPEMQLDYQPQDLYQMDLQELKHQSFDTDPNVGPFKLPDGQQNEQLEVKLATVSNLQPPDQAKFFASLPIDEWEQAGDWFLDQFSEVLKKLKESRQERRKAAKVFENEIETRHNAVGKKRKQTETELSLMKESGGKVLQGTPKKTRTK